MRVVEQARLGFREGKSDKLYEVDLVEVAAEQYVVNFRFGRRGSSLRDGTKTPLPGTLEKARAVFSAHEATSASRPASSAAPGEREARKVAELIAALGLGHRSETPLHLVVRKVGER